MLPLGSRLLARQQAAGLDPSLRLRSKEQLSGSGSFCPHLLPQHLCAPVPPMKPERVEKAGSSRVGERRAEFNGIVCQRSKGDPVCWTPSTSGAASTAAPPSKPFYVTHTGGGRKTAVGGSGSLLPTNGRRVASSPGEQKATADYRFFRTALICSSFFIIKGSLCWSRATFPPLLRLRVWLRSASLSGDADLRPTGRS